MGMETDLYDASFNSISEGSASSFSCVSSSLGFSSARSSISNDKPLTSLPSKPHKGNDAAWEAIRAVRCQDGPLGLSHFRFVKRLGSGDVGKVYLCRLRGFEAAAAVVFAMKVVDREALQHRNKLHRADVERQILSTLDHPFLPTLYAHFDASHYSCLVMEYCSGGDLHSLRQRQRGRRFGATSARFYAAEVVVALEYLHLMGVVYRDLKPENVLVREDGHIMLSDFDLSFRCDVVPTLQRRPAAEAAKRLHTPAAAAEEPVTACGCFFPWGNRRKKLKVAAAAAAAVAVAAAAEERRFFVAEPTEARSRSFVGTHEYLAPEVINGRGHGGAVDWWTLGIFLYEMLIGATPFKGATKEATLVNIVSQSLKFPTERPGRIDPATWESAKDLIKKLLARDPQRRLGSTLGSAEIKSHPFFKDVNWALIRSTVPPGKSRPSSRRRGFRRTKSPVDVLPHFDYF